jgi:hypothetical protein
MPVKPTLVIAPVPHTFRDLRGDNRNVCCRLVLKVGSLSFPAPDWEEMLGTVEELVRQTGELFGSVVEYDISFMKGPFRLNARRDLRKAAHRSTFDRSARLNVRMVSNDRTISGGAFSMQLQTYARMVFRAAEHFLVTADPRKRSPALLPLRTMLERISSSIETPG